MELTHIWLVWTVHNNALFQMASHLIAFNDNVYSGIKYVMYAFSHLLHLDLNWKRQSEQTTLFKSRNVNYI